MPELTPWRWSIALFAFSASVVFIINLAALLWSTSQDKNHTEDGSIVFREGSDEAQCSKIKNLSTWLHLLINILSTILLAGSNYCIQCLAVPSRPEVDRKHSKGKYFDIGIPSTHNLAYIPTRRRWLWVALLLSSLPLHLFYNSAVFTTTSSNNYAVFSVSETFVTGNGTEKYSFEDHSYILDSGIPTSALNTPTALISSVADDLLELNRNHSIHRLDSLECMQAYLASFQTNYRSLLLVTDNTTTTIKYLEARFYRDWLCSNQQASTWICAYDPNYSTGFENQCNPPCDTPSVLRDMQAAAANGSWSPLGDPVKYCLAQGSEGSCSLKVSTPILIIVTVLNSVKIMLLLGTLFLAFLTKEKPLLSMGDAVASFVDYPDSNTHDMCLLSREVFEILRCSAWMQGQLGRPVIRTFSIERKRWFSAARARRWSLCIFIYVIGLSTAGGYLGFGINNIQGSRDAQSLWQLGFGTVNARALIMTASGASGSGTLVRNVLLANIAQVVLSLLYFTYNGLFTAMLLSREWDTYATKRKGLRMSSSKPVGHQRSSYFLQLPYRWSVPLICFSLLLHWLVSQSIFVVDVEMLDYFGQTFKNGPNNVGHLVTCGYSPIAIIAVIGVGTFLVLGILIIAGRRLRSGMPVASSCSIAMSAACHPPIADKNMIEQGEGLPQSALKLQWGETGQLSSAVARAVRDLQPERPPLMQFDISKYNIVPGKAAQFSPTREMSDVEMRLLGNVNDDSAAVLAEYTDERRSAPSSIGHKAATISAAEVLGDSHCNSVDFESAKLEEEAIFHCSFSAGSVSVPVEGRQYA